MLTVFDRKNTQCCTFFLSNYNPLSHLEIVDLSHYIKHSPPGCEIMAQSQPEPWLLDSIHRNESIPHLYLPPPG